MTLERGWYLINDEELFLFASNGFWHTEQRMQTYHAVKKRYCGINIPQNEREKVLDELRERCEYNVEQSEKAAKKYPSLENANAGAVVAFKAVLEWIAELRKGGEG